MVRALLILLAAIFLAGSPAHAEWRRAVTPHFIVYSEGPEASLRQFAERLERFDGLLRMLSPGLADTQSSVKLQVFMIERESRLERLTGSRYIAGYYQPSVAGPIAVALANTRDTVFTPESILFHEYAHHFMYQNHTAAYPSWFVEGYAEFYATTQIAPDGSIRLGGIPEYRHYERNYDGVSLRRLLLANPWERRSGYFTYSDAWYLIHFFTFNHDRDGQLRRYLNLLAAGRPAEVAATEAFGDIGRLSAEFGSHRRNPALDVLEINFASAPPLPPISIEPLNEAEGEVQWYQLRYRWIFRDDERDGSADLARDLRARAAAAPTDPATLQLLADAEHLAGNRDAAMRAIDRLLELQPQSPRALLRKGLLEIDALADAEVTDEARWRTARRWIVRANHGAPDDPLILQSYYQSFVRQGVPPPDAAANGLIRAFELVPQDFRLRVELAEWMIGRRRHSEAMTLLSPVAFSAHRNDLAERARALAEQIQGIADGAEPRPAPPAEPARR